MPSSDRIAVLGLGYVGLPLALAFAKKGHAVVGYDVSLPHLNKLIQKYPKTKIHFTPNERDMDGCDVFILCVPTPLYENGKPDLSYVVKATETVAKYVKKGGMVILESTTYPGTTRELMAPILAQSGLVLGKHIDLVFSPERIDPGNPSFEVTNITKLVGGMDAKATKRAVELYSEIIDKVVPVDTPEIAEAAKIMENIFRNVNIALVNEMAVVFERMGIDTWKVVDAASTKPFGYMPFRPGPGIGGHCIPLDPLYMSYQARKYDFSPRFIELSADVNKFMEVHAVNLTRKALKKAGKPMRGSRVCVLGLSYKEDIEDTREAPSFPVIEELLAEGCKVTVYDPFVPAVTVEGREFKSEPDLKAALDNCDCALFMVRHKEFLKINWKKLGRPSLAVVDTRNLFEDAGKAVYVGLGKPAS